MYRHCIAYVIFVVTSGVSLSAHAESAPVFEENPMPEMRLHEVVTNRTIRKHYNRIINRSIREHLKRPPHTDALSGDTWIRLRIDNKGILLSSEIDESSGYAILDNAALKAVRDAAPYPEVLPEYKLCTEECPEFYEFRLPIQYKTRFAKN